MDDKKQPKGIVGNAVCATQAETSVLSLPAKLNTYINIHHKINIHENLSEFDEVHENSFGNQFGVDNDRVGVLSSVCSSSAHTKWKMNMV